MSDHAIISEEWTEAPRVLKCHRDGCDSPAEFHVGIEMQCRVSPVAHQMVQAPTTLKVCKRHMQAVGPYLMSNENKARMARGLMNDGLLPDFASAAVVFVPIKAAENNWQAAQEAGARH